MVLSFRAVLRRRTFCTSLGVCMPFSALSATRYTYVSSWSHHSYIRRSYSVGCTSRKAARLASRTHVVSYVIIPDYSWRVTSGPALETVESVSGCPVLGLP